MASSDGALMSLSTRSVSGSPASWRDSAAPSAPPAPVITTTRRWRGHPGGPRSSSTPDRLAGRIVDLDRVVHVLLICTDQYTTSVTVGPPSSWPAYSRSDLVEMYRRMLRDPRLRGAGLRRSTATARFPGFVHLSIGQEAAAVGACWPLGSTDVITSTHRGHGHCLAKGLDPLGDVRRADGQGPGAPTAAVAARCTSPTRSSGSSGPTGSSPPGLPIAVGAATAAQLRADGGVAVAFFGDGAPAAGRVPRGGEPGRRVAAAGGLLLREQRLRRVLPCVDPACGVPRASGRGYGIAYVAVDGNDVVATAAAMEDVVARRAGRGGPSSSRRPPTAGTATTRAIPSATGRPRRSRSGRRATRSLAPRGAATRGRRRRRRASKALESTVADELDAAVEEARRLAAARTRPPLTDFVCGRGRRDPSRRHPPDDAPVFRTMDAVHDALEAELAADDRVFVAGIDVGEGGNVFGLTRGLRDRFGDRVRDTPISETAIMGLGVGAAMAGMRPVVELMYLDFVGVCFDQLLNQAAKLPFMTGGAARDGADRPDPVRGRALLGQPALAEPRGAARPTSRGSPWSCRRRRPTPTACCAPPSRTPIRWSSSRTGCSTA